MDITTLIILLAIGLVVGLIARFLVPGPDPMDWVGTMVLGVLGSFVGGTLANLLLAGQATVQAAGWIGSIIGAVLLLLVYRAMTGRRVNV